MGGRRLRPAVLGHYANVCEGDRAGIVRVWCEPAPDGTTIAAVTCAMTAPSDEGAARLDRFAADYPQLLAHWEWAIAISA